MHRGPDGYFTGSVQIGAPFMGGGGLRAAAVAFSPGARTAWHSHPPGQTIIILSGTGRAVGRSGGGRAEDYRGLPQP